jgi:two-component system KDP operon response regulator KdpE
MNAIPASRRNPSILVIENDPQTRSLLRLTLSTEDYVLSEATTAISGLKQIEMLQPDAILLDPVLPDMNGLDVIRQVRILNHLSPIIVLSGRANESDKVTAFDAGADDFVVKPFIGSELLARLRAALRRIAPLLEKIEEPEFHAKGLAVNFSKREVRVEGARVHLTPSEFKLLRLFTRYPNRVLTHAVLITEIWGPGNEKKFVHSLRVCVASLRRKLCSGSTVWVRLQTESSVGYQLLTE